jgi:4-hydroxythreonine-4-phosphate dehydrogenase
VESLGKEDAKGRHTHSIHAGSNLEVLKLLIIADDLSGAADCGIACAGHGLNTVVALGDATYDTDADVLSVDGDTRRLDAKNAAAETIRLVQKYVHHNELLLFKKLDSTLRGNIGAELGAMLETLRSGQWKSERIVTVFAPAFPAAGRTTANGRQLVRGMPLEETEIWRRHGLTGEADISGMLSIAGMRSAHLPLALIRSSDRSLGDAMIELAKNADVLICDAETDEDLRGIANASFALGRGTVWAGSAGLARHLPPAAGLDRSLRYQSEQPLASGPALFVIGSVSRVSQEQVQVLATVPGVISVVLPPEILLTGSKSPGWRKLGLQLREALDTGRDVLASLGTQSEIEMAKAPLLSAALAAFVAPHADRVGALVASGGETARSVLEAWGVTGLRLIGELEAGLPFSVTEKWKRQLPVLTKAGDFGNPQTLFNCRQFLHQLDRAQFFAYEEETRAWNYRLLR